MTSPELVRAGTLQVVATPIGNLGDLTPRAADVLRETDLVVAEDTRRTGRLLAHIGADTPQWSLHEHNEQGRAAAVVERLRGGARVALVSDAGTPTISDPGFRLVVACAAAGIEVVAVPGPSAVVAALVTAALPTDRFVFDGFLPRSGGARRRRLEEIAREVRTVVVFISPHRAAADLADLAAACGHERPAAVCRELTKLHEQTRRGALGELAEEAHHDGIRGEITVVIGGAAPPRPGTFDEVDLAAMVAALEADGTPRKQAIADIASDLGIRKRVVYAAVIAQR